jgi:hypothetical protein
MSSTESNPLKLKMITSCPIIDHSWKRIILNLSRHLSDDIHQSLLDLWQHTDFIHLDSPPFCLQCSSDHSKKSASLNYNNKTYTLSLDSKTDSIDSSLELVFFINGTRSLSFEFSS